MGEARIHPMGSKLSLLFIKLLNGFILVCKQIHDRCSLLTAKSLLNKNAHLASGKNVALIKTSTLGVTMDIGKEWQGRVSFDLDI